MGIALAKSASILIQTEKSNTKPQISNNKEKTKTTETSNNQDSNSNNKKFDNPNFPILPGGFTYHLNCKKGQVANRILTVGDVGRGQRLAKYLDQEGLIEIVSNREFRIWTGTYKGYPVSIAVSLMGLQNMDFLIRETRYCVDGPIAVIRLGTCGLLSKNHKSGTVLVGRKVGLLTTNYSKALGLSDKDEYELKGPIEGDAQLLDLLENNLISALDHQNVLPGTICTADSFYSSQGRVQTGFKDYNEDLIDSVIEKNPDIIGLEMENFQLYILSKIAESKIHPAACQISLVNRYSKNDVVDSERAMELESICGQVVLESLIQFKFDEGEPQFTQYIFDQIQSQK